MSRTELSDTALEAEVNALLSSRKYRGLGIPPETVRSLLAQELSRRRSFREAVQSVREKLHNIVAPYLGDPDPAAALASLDAALAENTPQALQTACREILAAHASTRERLPILEQFYAGIFAVTGRPRVICDLACGLNPLAFPWMGLPASVEYHAYDLNQPRVDLLNQCLPRLGLAPLAEARDILLTPPEIVADVAFFFKEAHRFEQRQHGCNRPFFESIHARWLAVSLPTANLTGSRSLLEGHRLLVYNALEGQPWPVTEVLFENEIVFLIDKS